jgi:hypothetical protein
MELVLSGKPLDRHAANILASYYNNHAEKNKMAKPHRGFHMTQPQKWQDVLRLDIHNNLNRTAL